MRIECPGCSAAYDVPQEKLSPGRKVRCARCQTDWVPLEAEPARKNEPAAIEPSVISRDLSPPPAVTAMDRLAREVQPRRSRSGALAAAWFASFVVLAVIAWGAYEWRENIVRAWPASERAYVALGLR